MTKQFSFPNLDAPVNFYTFEDDDIVEAAVEVEHTQGTALHSLRVPRAVAQDVVEHLRSVFGVEFSVMTTTLTRALHAAYPSLVIDNVTMVELDKVVRS